MRIRDLECFLTVCEAGSINRAATELHIAQPALGVLVRRLEYEFGAPLIVRDSRGVRSTAEGDEVIAWARDVLDSQRRLSKRIRELSGGVGEVGLGLSPSAASLQAVQTMVSQGAWPLGLTLRFVEGSSHVLVDCVASHVLDVALSFDTPIVVGTEAEPLATQPLYLVGQNGEFAPGEEAAFELVLERPLIMGAATTSVRYVVEQAAHKVGAEIRVVQELMSVSLRREFVRRGFGATVLPLSAISDDLEAGRLSAAKIVGPDLTRTLFLIRQAKRQRTAEEESLFELIAGSVRQQSVFEPDHPLTGGEGGFAIQKQS